MKLENILVADARQSETNTAGRVKGKEFDDLVASIKEKGVLSPILVRALDATFKIGKWEVVAGNRRLAAAQAAGLKEIPAQIVVMTDAEAQEAQIVENLQRQDIHPLDEGEAYFKLVSTMADVKAVAIKVGKSESHVHNRVMLCNLVAEAKKAYRDGLINDGHAVEIAKLVPGTDQTQTLTEVKRRTSQGYSYAVKDLQAWIERAFYNEMAIQPWLKEKEALAAVGVCKECPPETNTLFGEVKEGACTALKCYKRKMEKFINWMKEKNPGLVLLTDSPWGGRGVLGKNDYKKCVKESKGARPALNVEGKAKGQMIYIKVEEKELPANAMTPEEKQKRDDLKVKEEAAEKKREEAEMAKENKKMEEFLKKITWPLKEKHLDGLFAVVTDNHNAQFEKIAERRKLDGKKDENGNYDDAEKVVGKFFIEQEPKVKIQMIIEFLLESNYYRNNLMKKFV